jgi:dTMP kinase
MIATIATVPRRTHAAVDRRRDRAAAPYTRPVTRPVPPAGRGRFITIEGPEGAGKTVQAARLEASLRDRGVEVRGTREPGGTALGERIRELLLAPAATPVDPLADALLFNAARRQLVEEVVEPALAAGTTVICARYADSTRAYQGYGAGLDLDVLATLEEIATGGLLPDLTLLLDIPVEVGIARKHPEDLTRFETGFDMAFHRRVRNGFLEMAVHEPGRFRVFDAAASKDEVAERILRAVDHLFFDDPPPADEPNRPVVRTHP